VYLDNSATTRLDPRVAAAMRAWLDDRHGNPSSLHEPGRLARAAVEAARAQVAALIGAAAGEIVFTGSGTEASNLALRGVLEQDGVVAGHVVTSAIEHPAVLETLAYLESRGAQVTRVWPAADGVVDPDDVAAALRDDTRLVSIMTANNAVGTIQPVAALARIAAHHGALFHTDAVQAVGKVPLAVGAAGIDLLSLSGHKFHGPQGVGALYVREGVALSPLVYGGGQERGLRSATENVPGLVGLGLAAEIARQEMAAEACRLVGLRDRIIDGTLRAIPCAYVVGDRWRRLPGHVCLGFAGLEGEAIKLLLALDEEGIAVSSGSACSAHHGATPSHVLTAMGFDPIAARGSLRITLGRFNVDDDVDRLLDVLPRAVATLRPLTSSR
jgi:cysteine desulfurase